MSKYEITGNLDASYWVQKSDPLFLMRSVPFTLGELKILDTYISRINASDSEATTVIFTKDEYERLMGISKTNAETLKKHTRGLLGKVVELQMPNKNYLQFVLFIAAEYRLDEYGIPIIELSCSEKAKDLFFCINKYHYYKYALENVINLTHKASYLLYIYLLPNRFRKSWIISVDELRDNVFDCKNNESYKKYKEFKRAVLDPAVKELNEKTDCNFRYEPIKTGRTITGINFIFNKQIEVAPDASQLSFGLEEIDYGSELGNLLGTAICQDEFSVKQVRILQDLVQKAETGDTIQKCNYLKEKVNLLNYYSMTKGVKNRFLYLKKLIENDIKG